MTIPPGHYLLKLVTAIQHSHKANETVKKKSNIVRPGPEPIVPLT